MSHVPGGRVLARTLLALAAGSSALAPAFAQHSPSSPDPASAASANRAPALTLAAAFRAALAQQAWMAGTRERAREHDARETLADAWLADSPTLSSSIKAGSRESLREYEVELSAPIATPTRRGLQVAAARGETALYRAGIEQQKLKVAGGIRDAYWALQLALAESTLADDELRRAETLAADAARRAAAGDAARVDSLQAEALLRAAQGERFATQLRALAARQALSALAGEMAGEPSADAEETRSIASTAALALHPALRHAELAADLARAKRNEAAALINAAPTLSLALSNERSSSGSPASAARIGVAIPFGGATRSAPRIAQAEAELTEALAATRQLQRQLAIEAQGAERAAAATAQRVAALSERARLAQEVSDLYAKAYRLGELDLPTRIRTDGERAAAQLALTRARLELRHAQSRVNQSLGLLP